MSDIIIYTTPEKLLHKQDKLKNDPDKSDEGCYFWQFRNMPKIKSGDKVYFATKGFIRGYFIVLDINTEESTQDPMGMPDNSISWLSKSWKDIDTIIPLIKERFHINFPSGYSMFFDFISRFKQNKYIWPVIDKIKQDCQVGLLTNMYPKMLPTMIEKELMPPVIWDVIIDSSIVYCWKPDLAIFKLAEQKANAKKKNILFIDNKIANIDAAKNFGWQTFLYNPSDHDKSCAELLDYYNRIK